METLLKKVMDSTTENNVTISINTHRNSPTYREDNILLRNKIREAEVILQNKMPNSKSQTNKIVTSLNKLADEIDHSLNLESLVVFANENIATYIRLPIAVEDRLSVCGEFIVRDIIRALYANLRYYIFFLNLKESCLYEVYNDRPVNTIESDFPTLVSDEPIGKSNNRSIHFSSKDLNARNNFFTMIDRHLNDIIEDAKMPILVCSEDSTYADFINISTLKNQIVGSFNFGYKNIKNMEIHLAEAGWEVMQKYNDKKNREKISELDIALNSGNYKVDVNEIADYISKGRGKTLFVKTNYFLSAVIEDGIYLPVKNTERGEVGVIDDIISEFILSNITKGGNVVFFADDTLNRYNSLLLTTKQ